MASSSWAKTATTATTPTATAATFDVVASPIYETAGSNIQLTLIHVDTFQGTGVDTDPEGQRELDVLHVATRQRADASHPGECDVVVGYTNTLGGFGGQATWPYQDLRECLVAQSNVGPWRHHGARSDASPKDEPSALEAPLEARGPRAEDTGAAPEAPGESATEVLVSTELAPDLPADVWKMLGRLPFRPASLEQAAARTLQVPVMTRNLGDTAPVADDAMAKAVAALPFTGNTVGAGIVPFPRLKLTEYASLHAELRVWPERAGEIVPRYYVPSEAARKALEEHWARRLAENVEERAAFERAVEEYSAWLRWRSGGEGRGHGR
jgi:hypothetical protein